MTELAREILARVTTVSEMVVAFQSEERCQRLLEAMIWPRDRICPACGCLAVKGPSPQTVLSERAPTKSAFPTFS